jgi:regulator of protease activity HflC (stomatin/prohibitin superfamily)
MVNECKRTVIFRLGRLSGVKGPAIFLITPLIDKVIKLDLRVVALDIPKQAVLTQDNVTVEVYSVVYYKIVEPGAAIIQVENYKFTIYALSQTTLRDVLGQMELDGLLSERESINKRVQELLDAYTDPWGIKVTRVTIRDVPLPDTMKRAIAKQAEAEREKCSRIILAEREYQTGQKI